MFSRPLAVGMPGLEYVRRVLELTLAHKCDGRIAIPFVSVLFVVDEVAQSGYEVLGFLHLRRLGRNGRRGYRPHVCSNGVIAKSLPPRQLSPRET